MTMSIKSLKSAFQALALSLLCIGVAFAGETVNINTADAATLARVLHDVGPSKAEAIVEYRRKNGVFRSAEQLAMVRGIRLATVERNADRIVVEAARPEPRAADGMPRAEARTH